MVFTNEGFQTDSRKKPFLANQISYLRAPANQRATLKYQFESRLKLFYLFSILFCLFGLDQNETFSDRVWIEFDKVFDHPKLL